MLTNLVGQIRQFLSVSPSDTLVLERYSDSLANYILLDSENPAVYKQLYRAAKAKLKLRIKATITPKTPFDGPSVTPIVEKSQPQEQSYQPYRYPRTVLSPPSSNEPVSPLVPKSDSQPTQTMASPHILPPPVSTREEKPRAFPLRFSHNDNPGSMFCIDCNNCGRSIPAEHYHCSICDEGDYDLCPACVDAGFSCSGKDHWLLKRLVQNGVIINSTTETIAPRRLRSPQPPARESTDNVTLVEKTEEEPKMEKETFMDRTQNVFDEAKQDKHAEYEKPASIPPIRTCNACFNGELRTSVYIFNLSDMTNTWWPQSLQRQRWCAATTATTTTCV